MTEVTLYHGDCLEILPPLEAGSVDAVITDPPYGIDADKGKKSGRDKTGFYSCAIRKEYNDSWDNRPSDDCIYYISQLSNTCIIWGGNYFANTLSLSTHWLVWNKLNTMPTYSDCELAWTNIDRKSVKMFTYSGNGLMAKEKNRVHPTQKPISLMKWCINNYTDPGATILDPFMGSGTTGVACVQTGRNFIGIEIDKGYFEIAEKRIKQAQLQIRMPI